MWFDGTGLDDTIMEEDEEERLVSWVWRKVCVGGGGECVGGGKCVWEGGGGRQENECH